MSLLECQAIASLEISVFPRPQFVIGDLVSEYWETDDARGIHHAGTDFGEVLGMRWMPEHLGWGYFVEWTHSTSDLFSYPNYDGELTPEDALSLVSRR